MDKYLIQEAITELENGETTLENITELASLYIVVDHFPINKVEDELNDILPAYGNYVAVKRQYQLRETTESGLVKAMKLLCTEIEEFITTLYQCTDANRERKCLKDALENIIKNF